MKNPEDEVAELFGLEGDTLAQHNAKMKQLDIDWYDYYFEEFVERKDIRPGTKRHYRDSFDDWKEFMSQYDRHPTLANDHHVEAFVDECLERMQGERVRKKLNHIKQVYEWMQINDRFPHPSNYNPFMVVKDKRKGDLKETEPDDYPKLLLDDVVNVVEDIKHIGERAVTVIQLKTGIRSSELCNIRLEHIHITNPDVLAHYDEMGTHDQLDGIANAVYIPPEDKMPGNKREMPTVIPLDDEVRRVLIDWLLIRPDNGDQHVFLTKKGKPMDKSSLRNIWTNHWWPEYEYGEDDEFRSITPHYSRHWMSSWLRVKGNMDEPLVQYLRGDKQGPDMGGSRSAFHRYIHAYYEDVEEEYRDRIFRLGI